MRVVRNRRPLPRIWSTHPAARGRVVAEHDIAVSSGSRLRAKLLVFKSRTAMRLFWKAGLQRSGHSESLGFGCWGVVNGLAHEWIDVLANDGGERHRMQVDQRYFCVIGLVKGMAGECSPMEVISHEAMHAGFCYAKRVKNRNLWAGAAALDEESVCYPAGRIARKINKFMHEKVLF